MFRGVVIFGGLLILGRGVFRAGRFWWWLVLVGVVFLMLLYFGCVGFLICWAGMLLYPYFWAVACFGGGVFFRGDFLHFRAFCRVSPVLTVPFLRVLGVFCGWSVVQLVGSVWLIFHFLKALD